MSHFSVAVFTDGTKTVDELMAPYDENLQVESYICKTRAEIIALAKERQLRAKEKVGNGEDIAEWLEPYLSAVTDEDFYKLETYEDETYDEEGNELSTYNPNSKWDWYQTGGRYGGAYASHVGYDGECKVADLILYDEKIYKKEKRWWEVVVEESPLRDGEDEDGFFTIYKKEYYLDRYKDKETFAKIMASFYTYAVVTPDGVWHEKGKMGWFGMSSETGDESFDWDMHYKERFIDTADPDWTVTILDCHI